MFDPDTIRTLRLYVDGELPEADAAAFEQRLAGEADLQARVDFERRLRDHVADVLRAEVPSAPAELETHLRTAIARADDADPASAAAPAPGEPAASAPPPPVAGRLRPAGPAGTARPSHASPSRRHAPPRANAFMIAATLVLVAAAVLIGIFGPSIDEVRPNSDLVHDAALWASNEHGRCAGDDSAKDGKLRWSDFDLVPVRVAEHLGMGGVCVPSLGSAVGYDFVGAGPCEVPSDGAPSAHLMYRRQPGESRGSAMISLFIVPDHGQFDRDLPRGMEPGEWYAADGGPKCGHRILRCTDSRLVYFLVCCDEGDLELAAGAVARDLGRVR